MTLQHGEGLPLDWLYRWERETPERVYFTQPHDHGKLRRWTWAQAVGEARRMATYLGTLGLEPGSRIAILSRNCAWWLMADYAIWMAGHVSVPVYPSLKPHSIRAILEHSQARVCFVGATDEAEAGAAGVPAGVVTIALPTAPHAGGRNWDDVVAATAPLAGNRLRPPEELATIIYTSGTTGVPKGVMHGFGSLACGARGLAALLDLNEGHRLFSYLPLAHIVERCAVELESLLLGAPVAFTEGLETFVKDIQRARPTIFVSVPRLLVKFQQGVFAKIPRERLERMLAIPLVGYLVRRRILKQLGLNTVRHAASGAAALPREVLLWYRRIGLDLAEGYGMTETLITHLPSPGNVRPGWLGTPLADVEARIAEGGELEIRSPMNMLGYYRDFAGTAQAFTLDGFFRTGDLGRIDTDGQLCLLGRIKEQFKTSKGKYVAPSPIESQLCAHPSVESCCLMGAGQPTPFAVIVLSPDARQKCAVPRYREELEASLTSRMNEVNSRLDPHERVAFIAVVEGPWSVGNGLMTPTLKVKRAALENAYTPLVDAWYRQGRPVVWECELREGVTGA